MKKKIVSLVVALVLLCSVSQPLFAANDKPTTKIECQGLTYEEAVAISDPYVTTNPDGTLSLRLPKNKINEIGAKYYSGFMSGIGSVNQAIRKGTLDTTANGTIYAQNDDKMVIQGGYRDDISYQWWGWTRWYNKANTDRLIRDMNKICIGGAGVATVASLFQPYGSAVAIPTIITACIAGFISSDANYYNNPRGIIMDTPWIVVGYTMRKQ